MASIHDRESIWQMVEKRLKKGHEDIDESIFRIYEEDQVEHPEDVQTQLAKVQKEYDKLLKLLDTESFVVETLHLGNSVATFKIVEREQVKRKRLEPRLEPLRAKHALLNKFGDHMREQIILCSSGAELRSWFEDTIKELRKL